MREPLTVALDAATATASVAILRGTRVLHCTPVAMRGVHEERLMPAIIDALAVSRSPIDAVDRVACGGGPGSFTSLRIAAAIAKGLAVSRRVPLVTASSLALIVAGDSSLGAGRFLAQLDAMRGDRFVQRVSVDQRGRVEVEGAPLLVPAAEALTLAVDEARLRVGRPDAAFDADPSAAGFARVEATEVDLIGWEPQYGRLAEAQVQWELRHGRPLDAR